MEKRFGILSHDIDYIINLVNNIDLWEETNESYNVDNTVYLVIDTIYRCINNPKLEYF